MAIKVNPISASPTEVDFSRGQSIEVIQLALNNHNDDGRPRAVSFFLFFGAKRARNENDHARDGRPSFLASLPARARARMHSPHQI